MSSSASFRGAGARSSPKRHSAQRFTVRSDNLPHRRPIAETPRSTYSEILGVFYCLTLLASFASDLP